jgi:hypothetical protein
MELFSLSPLAFFIVSLTLKSTVPAGEILIFLMSIHPFDDDNGANKMPLTAYGLTGIVNCVRIVERNRYAVALNHFSLRL